MPHELATNFVESGGVITLDGRVYKLQRPVRSTLAADFAPKQVIGPETMDSHEGVSYLRWHNWTGGVGMDEFFAAGGEAPPRAWYSTCNLSHSGHLTLGPLVTKTADPGDTPIALINSSPMPVLAEFGGEIYAAWMTDIAGTERVSIYKYNNSTDSWGSALATSGVVNTSDAGEFGVSVAVGIIGGTEYIVFSNSSRYLYSTDGATWNERTKDAVHLTTFDDRLWGLALDGNVWYSVSPGTETDVARIPVPQGPVTTTSNFTNLFVARAGNGIESLFAGTAWGLYIYDIDNDRWVRTDITMPKARFNSRGADSWNGDLYVGVGGGVYRVIMGDPIAVVSMGPDREDGLPQNVRGAVRSLTGGHFQLLAATDSLMEDFQNFGTGALTGAILAWDGAGWQVIRADRVTTGEKYKHVIVASAYDTYRIWFSSNHSSAPRQRVYYVDIPSERNSPDITIQTYAAESVHETPWYEVGQDVTGIALSLTTEASRVTATETVKVEYLLDQGVSPNYMDGGGFEDGIGAWGPRRGHGVTADISHTTTDALVGNGSLEIDLTASTAVGNALMFQKQLAHEGQIFNCSVRVEGVAYSDAEAQFQVQFRDIHEQILLQTVESSTLIGEETLTINASAAPEDTRFIFIECVVRALVVGGTGKARFDSVVVSDTTASTSAVTMGLVTTNGATEFKFPDSNHPEGIEFRAIRFRLTLARGGTTTATPDVHSLTLKFVKKLRPRWHHLVELDISQDSGGFSPRQQWYNLRDIIETKTLVEFTHKDRYETNADQRDWVQVEVPNTEEESGLEYRGTATLLLKEP